MLCRTQVVVTKWECVSVWVCLAKHIYLFFLFIFLITILEVFKLKIGAPEMGESRWGSTGRSGDGLRPLYWKTLLHMKDSTSILLDMH